MWNGDQGAFQPLGSVTHRGRSSGVLRMRRGRACACQAHTGPIGQFQALGTWDDAVRGEGLHHSEHSIKFYSGCALPLLSKVSVAHGNRYPKESTKKGGTEVRLVLFF